MSFFNSNITGAGGSGGAAGGLVTKFEKSVTIGSEETAEIQISLKDDISNYANITDEQIIVDITNVGASETGTANLTQSYDAEQGVITITSDSSKIPFIVDSTVEVIVYVAGAVQLPPAPEYAVPTLGAMVGYAETGPNTSTGAVSIALTKNGLTVNDIVVLYANVTFGQGRVYNGTESQNFNVRQTSLKIENNVLKINTGGFSSSNVSGGSTYSNKSYIGATKVFVFEKG